MVDPHHAYEAYRSGGLRGLLRGTHRSLLRKSSVYCRLHSPIVYTIGGETARFKVTSPESYFRIKSVLEHEENIISDMMVNVSAGDTVWDIGANAGVHSTYLGKRGANVIAFEPHPGNQSILKFNTETNVPGKIRILSRALSNENGVIPFHAPTEDTFEASVSIVDADDEQEHITVPVSRGDDLVEAGTCPVPSVVKVDVEGAEGMVIEGMKTVLSEHVRLLYCEIHHDNEYGRSVGQFGYTEHSIRDSIKECGFELSTLESRRGQTLLRCEKERCE